MKRAISLIGLVALAACGSGEESTTLGGTTYTSNEQAGTATISGERGTLSVAEGDAAANTPMPDFAPQYPGARITSTLSSEREGVKRTNVVLTTADAPAKVVDFYKERFTGSGLEMKSEMIVETGGILSAEGNGKKASATVSQDEETKETSIVISFSEA